MRHCKVSLVIRQFCTAKLFMLSEDFDLITLKPAIAFMLDQVPLVCFFECRGHNGMDGSSTVNALPSRELSNVSKT